VRRHHGEQQQQRPQDVGRHERDPHPGEALAETVLHLRECVERETDKRDPRINPPASRWVRALSPSALRMAITCATPCRTLSHANVLLAEATEVSWVIGSSGPGGARARFVGAALLRG
jgi:hypothetical protein